MQTSCTQAGGKVAIAENEQCTVRRALPHQLLQRKPSCDLPHTTVRRSALQCAAATLCTARSSQPHLSCNVQRTCPAKYPPLVLTRCTGCPSTLDSAASSCLCSQSAAPAGTWKTSAAGKPTFQRLVGVGGSGASYVACLQLLQLPMKQSGPVQGGLQRSSTCQPVSRASKQQAAAKVQRSTSNHITTSAACHSMACHNAACHSAAQRASSVVQ